MSLAKFLWYTDTHLAKMPPWRFFSFIREIIREKPSGIFLTGDISTGPLLGIHLKLISRLVKCPIYFTLGNHDYHHTSFTKQHKRIKKICNDYPNLIWMNNAGIVALTSDTALIGVEGWYDANLGNPNYLKFTLDWILIEDFRNLSSIEERISLFRSLSKQSSSLLDDKLKKALEKYEKVYILTHFPPWKEATRDEGTILEPLYLPYNVNLILGKTIEEIMSKRRQSVEVFCGHTHCPEYIHVSRNIRCQVGEARKKHIIYA